MYIHERADWTKFRWDNDRIALLLDEVCRSQGRLYGRLAGLGFDERLSAMADNLTLELVGSSEIEGIRLNIDEVRSSIARHLGIEQVKETAPSHYVENVVAVMLDALEHCTQPLTKERLCAWQASFFPTGYSEGYEIEVGKYRTHEEHIVSGALGHEKVHYVAPSPDRVEGEMTQFLSWFNSHQPQSPLVRSAIAHLWFVTIHPFEDGNGRLARIIGEMWLARGDGSTQRFYNISSQINRDKRHYYNVLKRTQAGDGEISEWLEWYLQTLLKAIHAADTTLSLVIDKSRFWSHAAKITLNERQRNTLNHYLDGHEGKISTKTWVVHNKCSQDTALRDIRDLISKGLLRQEVPGAKRPSFSIVFPED